MKTIILLLSVVTLFGACQKKEYPIFIYPNTGYLHQPLTESTILAEATQTSIEAPSALSASAVGNSFIEKDIRETTVTEEAISSKKKHVQLVAKESSATKMTWQRKVIAKKIQKRIEKAVSPVKAQKAKTSDNDTLAMALLSMLFGGIGLLSLLASSGAGLILGIIGLVFGIISLSRIKKGDSSPSAKRMALLGAWLGGLAAFLGGIIIFLNNYLVL